MPDPAWGRIAALFLSGILLYIAGNFFNDWMDQDWDARHRPGRALPAGGFRSMTYGITALTLGLAGLLLGSWAGPAAGQICGVIVIGIIAYTFFHKRVAWATVFMGGCRGALVWLGASACFPESLEWNPGVALASGAVFCYIVALSLAARRESSRTPAAPREHLVIAGLFLLVPSLMLINPDIRAFGPWCLAGLVPYGVWLGLCHRTRVNGVEAYVSALLAGIPLVDWILLLPLAIHDLADHGKNIHGMTLVAGILPPLIFVAARALQRLAPAT
jgi:4-hydroxybenzoate polyprenyltransferase